MSGPEAGREQDGGDRGYSKREVSVARQGESLEALRKDWF